MVEILPLGLGKSKSVACVFNTTAGEYAALPPIPTQSNDPEFNLDATLWQNLNNMQQLG